jgi:hypothetical protein
MSSSFFSKLDAKEKESRLQQTGVARAIVTIWKKGAKQKFTYTVRDADPTRAELVLDSSDDPFSVGTEVLCTFDVRGMNFFAQVRCMKSVTNNIVLHFYSDLFKAERRSSYRLMTFPVYEVYAQFDLAKPYEGEKVIDLKSRTSQTAMFKNYLQLIEKNSDQPLQKARYRIQDISATGMSLHIGELDGDLFVKDSTYKEVEIQFSDETITIPEVKVVYVIPAISKDRNLRTFKVGLNFPNLPAIVDDQLGKKINQLLREVDLNKDFETFLK